MKRKLKPIFKVIGAPEWMTTFADMMTLLLTFFILLYSVSKVEAVKVFEMGKSFEKYFKLDTPYFGYSTQPVKLEKLSTVLAELGAPDDKIGSRGRSLESKEAEIIDRYASLSREGSFHLIIIQGSVLFEPGTATISQEAKPSLLRVAGRLHRYKNRIKVLGHASTLPLDPSSGVADHDELGYRRAKAVGRFLSGEEEDLVSLAQKILPQRGERIIEDIFSVEPARFIYATRGYHSPLDTGRLWLDPQRNDRVELVFLPEFVDGSPGADAR
jgi:chemotaxis protein MotB